MLYLTLNMVGTPAVRLKILTHQPPKHQNRSECWKTRWAWGRAWGLNMHIYSREHNMMQLKWKQGLLHADDLQNPKLCQTAQASGAIPRSQPLWRTRCRGSNADGNFLEQRPGLAHLCGGRTAPTRCSHHHSCLAVPTCLFNSGNAAFACARCPWHGTYMNLCKRL